MVLEMEKEVVEVEEDMLMVACGCLAIVWTQVESSFVVV